jgi:hypothetical protein
MNASTANFLPLESWNGLTHLEAREAVALVVAEQVVAVAVLAREVVAFVYVHLTVRTSEA